MLHSMYVSGSINEFILSPVETIEKLINVSIEDTIGENVLPEEEISCIVEYANQKEKQWKKLI